MAITREMRSIMVCVIILIIPGVIGWSLTSMTRANLAKLAELEQALDRANGNHPGDLPHTAILPPPTITGGAGVVFCQAYSEKRREPVLITMQSHDRIWIELPTIFEDRIDVQCIRAK